MKSLTKYVFIFAALMAIPIASNAVDYEHEAKTAVKKNSCPMKNDEEVVCAMIMCGFGASMGEYPSECNQVKLDFVAYVATLGFWDKPAKCFMRDSSCAKTGKASKKTESSTLCEDPDTGKVDEACLKGLNVFNMDCDEFEDKKQRDQCYLSLAQANAECKKLSGGAKAKCEGLNAGAVVSQAHDKAVSECATEPPAKQAMCISLTTRTLAKSVCDTYSGAYSDCTDAIDEELSEAGF